MSYLPFAYCFSTIKQACYFLQILSLKFATDLNSVEKLLLGFFFNCYFNELFFRVRRPMKLYMSQ